MRALLRAWRSAVLAVTGPPISLAGLLVIAVAGAFWPRAIGSLVASWHRQRYAALLGVRLVPPAPGQGVRRQIVFGLIVAPLSVISAAAVILCWSVAMLGAIWLSFGWVVPRGSTGWLQYDDSFVTTSVAVAASLLLILGLVVARQFARLELRLAEVMLQASRAETLSVRVDALAESRAEVVDAADAERRRIERDLHDGAQQRLVSLAMNLGLARATLTDADPRVTQALTDAHDEAKLALTELRQLVRGLHPAVLDDRGLDAALSGIAARSPVPVRLTVAVPNRPSRTIEAVAYFVVAEALANVAKHADASSITVTIGRAGDRLSVVIADDGRGGADPAHGTGLRGLAQRVGSVDGTLRLSSPAGGPTVIEVELPCES
ncbi:sensor histidine kinase [Hamadaea sp.]|uniref:sensor histidine kinase n=1 Tax=Hamadaea sp. TaxID=2024425 RepID=UPI0025BBE96D|nr:sensor histidine kinase [Hamadaea sp.]